MQNDHLLTLTTKLRDNNLVLGGVVSVLLGLNTLATLLKRELLGVSLLRGLLPLGEVGLVGLGVRRVFTDLFVSLTEDVVEE
jgi:hypothetical protein